MKTPFPVLAAVDFSTGSHAALLQAVRAAAARGAPLHVLHVVDSAAVATIAETRGETYAAHADAAAKGAQAALERWLGQCGVHSPCQATIAVGHPVREILEHVRTLQAGLLVAGLQGAGQSTAGAGSVAAKLARKSPVPVLLVRPGHPHAFQKILACVDFSPASAQVMEEARQLARENATGLECLHVWQEPWVVDFDPESTMTSAYPVIIFTKEERQAHTQQLQEELRRHMGAAAPDVPCTEALREALSPGAGIVDHAREHQADLIVLGSTGHHQLRDALLGSTAERVLHHVPCSLLVVRTKPAAQPPARPNGGQEKPCSCQPLPSLAS